jgi:hypothetical protein
MLIPNLRMGITRPNPPTLAEVEQQREELLTQVDLPSQHATSPAEPDPASPPITALPTPEPLPLPFHRPPQPPHHQQQAPAAQHSRQSVLRISALYAAPDCSSIIQLPHLQAALALWDYCSDSAASLFGACVGDSVADRIPRGPSGGGERPYLKTDPASLPWPRQWQLYRPGPRKTQLPRTS